MIRGLAAFAATPFKIPEDAGRSERYMVLRAIERVDPVSVFGLPWTKLTFEQGIELLAFSDFRDHEDAQSFVGTD